jgi:hypothetical protein
LLFATCRARGEGEGRINSMHLLEARLNSPP